MINILSLIVIVGVFLLHSSVVVFAAEKTDSAIRISSFERTVAKEPNVATRNIASESNTSFTVPYIQTSDDIRASVEIIGDNAVIKKVLFILSKNGQIVEERILTAPYTTVFQYLKKGEYTLDAYVLDAQEKKLSGKKFHDQVTNIGIGDIIIAIGDSTTEGYFLYKSPIQNWLAAPSEYLSSDHRTYPQPGGKATLPTQTWLPELSDQLTKVYGYPIFIKNAGYSEFTTEDYLMLMRTKAWQDRQHALQPSKWIVLLGVNDGLHHVSAGKYNKNLQAIIAILKNDYHATATDIILAKPTYAIGIDHTTKLLPTIDALWKQGTVSKGPDFWQFFSSRYGPPNSFYKDQFHPNAQGMKEMSKLWTTSFVERESFWFRSSFYMQSYLKRFFEKVQSKVSF